MRIYGPSGSTATSAICSRCRTISRARFAEALDLALISTEAARPTEHPDALDYIYRRRAALSKPLSRNVLAEAISLFERRVVGRNRLHAPAHTSRRWRSLPNIPQVVQTPRLPPLSTLFPILRWW
jgi:hypothetical protein